MPQKSKTRWGWVAFGFGLTLCVIAGGVLGVVLGSDDGRSDADEARRVAALALETRGLNDDALALSSAIEEAIEREGLESEAVALRAQLAAMKERAGRIRVLTRPEFVAAVPEEGTGEASAIEVRRAMRGLGEVRSALAVFEREVVSRLDSVLVSQPSEASAVTALAEATEVLERQDEAMTNLTSDLIGPNAAGEPRERAGDPEGGGAYPISGSFEGTSIAGDTLELEYELDRLEAEIDDADAGSGMTVVSGSASGQMTVTNSADPGGASIEVPAFRVVLYWEELGVPLAARQGEILLGAPEVEAEGGEGVLEEVAESAETEAEEAAPCRYELSGERYCALAAFAFGDGAGGVIAEPGEEVEIGVPEPIGSLMLFTQDADPVAEFLGSNPPALVQVLDTGPESLLRPACAIPAADGEPEGGGVEEGEPLGLTVGLLEGDGTIVFEAEPADAEAGGESVGGAVGEPQCYEVHGE